MFYDKYAMEIYLKICLEHKDIANFICGEGVFAIHSNPHDRSSCHSFYSSQLALNDYYRKYPNSELDKMYVEAVNAILDDSGEKYGNNYVYDVFKSLRTQLLLEREGKASFCVDKNELVLTLEKLNNRIQFYEQKLKNAKYNEGAFYPDGVYGYLMYACEEFYKETGYRIR